MMEGDSTEERWRVALIDPPWPQKMGGFKKVRPNQVGPFDYKTMSVEAIFNLLDYDVFSTAQPEHTVFLWGIDKFLHEGESEMEKRGYRRHARLIWDKQNGVAPAFSVRFTHEYLTWFYKGKFMPVDVDMRGKVATVLREASRQHSRKPEIVYQIIEKWFPDAVKIDVFSRENRDGWLVYGDECGKFDQDRRIEKAKELAG